jgi:hypothetical protein
VPLSAVPCGPKRLASGVRTTVGECLTLRTPYEVPVQVSVFGVFGYLDRWRSSLSSLTAATERRD